ncbi:MAG: T9SS type A sorting domain-containing protein [Chloroherpetonaceae bacterium]|nr:T9SS type A sorting domain-containing protein [Chloroherpetonaceae bacterium]MCS7210446.1 T9SS type A sorting domain-containing protein [Chloroherpetonaceae bacterium]MDW8018863.1 T9SS type A sorting domain-containing protein [Chloroherpetonaceae bacterium]
MNKRVMLTLLLIVTLVSHLWAQAQPQRLLFAIRGFGSSTSPQPTQALTLINLTTGVVRDSIAAIGPIANVIRVRNNRLYIVNSGANFNGTANSIQIINIPDIINNVTPLPITTVRIPDGRNPYDLVFLNDSKAYITNFLDSAVTIFNAANNTLSGLIRIIPGQQNAFIVGSKLYVARSVDSRTFAPDSTVFVINTVADTVLGRIRVRPNPQGITPDRLGRLHVVCTGFFGARSPDSLGFVTVINPANDQVVGTLAVGGNPSSVVINSENVGILSTGTLYNASLLSTLTRTAPAGTLGFGDTLFVVRTTPGGNRRLVLFNARTLDSLTQFTLGSTQPYLSLTPVTLRPDGVASADRNAARPMKFELFQNYPNPFNPTTMIGYSLPVASEVSLKVYDMLGREVATLVSGRQAAGEYQVSFTATGLSSGIYFYRLQAGNFVETKKMMLVK